MSTVTLHRTAPYGKDATDGASRLKISVPEKRRQTPLRQSRKPRPMAMLWYATDYAWKSRGFAWMTHETPDGC